MSPFMRAISFELKEANVWSRAKSCVLSVARPCAAR
jgi:hypothetical protein